MDTSQFAVRMESLSEQELHSYLVYGVFALGAVTFVATSVITAPYGRHSRPGWGPSVDNRLGWVLMESPSVLWFSLVYSWGSNRWASTPLVGATLWLTHYVYRAGVYPFLIRSSSSKRIPLTVMLAGDAYNFVNAYVNARYLSQFGDYRHDELLARPSFYLGLLLFGFGLVSNIKADQTLIHLRRPGETGYRIPTGGLFELVTAPNYFAEILEWAGWSLLTGSPAGWSFALYTAANLVPRAVSNHRWYQDKFRDEYPASRRAIFPWVY